MMRLPGALEAWGAPAANEVLCLIAPKLFYTLYVGCTWGSVLCEAGRFHRSEIHPTVMNFKCGGNLKVQGGKKLC